jgi:hypothetical protein
MSSISREQFLNYCKEKQKLDQKYGNIIVESAKIKENEKDLKKQSKLESQKAKLDDPEYLEKKEARRLKQLERQKLAYYAKKQGPPKTEDTLDTVSIDSDRTLTPKISPEPPNAFVKDVPKRFIGNYF